MPKRPDLPGVDALFRRPDAEGAEHEEEEEDREEVPEETPGPVEREEEPRTSKLAETAEPETRPAKFTFYFAPGTLDALEFAWFELRRRTGRKISKSEIVDRIVWTSVQDLDELEKLLTA